MKKILNFVKKYFQNILIGFDQFVNVVMFGDPDETISSRAGRVFPDSWWSGFIDWLFFWQSHHTYNAIEKSEGKRDLLFPRED